MSQFTLTSELARKAIDTVRKALPLFIPAPPIIHRGPEGYHIDVPILYMDFAIDRVHFNADTNSPSPKGFPVSSGILPKGEEIIERMKVVLSESQVLEACEFRKPERAWVVPVAWEGFIIMHVKVSFDGEKIIPDYPLTEEVRRNVIRY